MVWNGNGRCKRGQISKNTIFKSGRKKIQNEYARNDRVVEVGQSSQWGIGWWDTESHCNEWDFGHLCASACHAAEEPPWPTFCQLASACMSMHPHSHTVHTHTHTYRQAHTHKHMDQRRQLWATGKEKKKLKVHIHYILFSPFLSSFQPSKIRWNWRTSPTASIQKDILNIF